MPRKLWCGVRPAGRSSGLAAVLLSAGEKPPGLSSASCAPNFRGLELYAIAGGFLGQFLRREGMRLRWPRAHWNHAAATRWMSRIHPIPVTPATAPANLATMAWMLLASVHPAGALTP